MSEDGQVGLEFTEAGSGEVSPKRARGRCSPGQLLRKQAGENRRTISPALFLFPGLGVQKRQVTQAFRGTLRALAPPLFLWGN